ncbi:MAG: hypothetical protein J6T80_01160 [Paludibacteraceae bacterium]|nr:hypothetical protein [Paludibacteraceae bacterium]
MKKDFWDNFQSHKVVRIFKIISESAVFALLLSLILFGVEMFNEMEDSREMTKNLLEIQNSLSTRYLGEFPNFVPDINQLYSEAKAGDSIVVLEDVLFYGITSAPGEFYEATTKLLDLAAAGSHVMIAYYRPHGLAYDFMMQEWLLSQEQYNHFRDTMTLFERRQHAYKEEMRALMDSCRTNEVNKTETRRLMRALMDKSFGDVIGKQRDGKPVIAYSSDNEQVKAMFLERYFAKTREEDRAAFKAMIAKYRYPTTRALPTDISTRTELETAEMCHQMDSVRIQYLGREGASIDKPTYADFVNMFADMTQVMERTFQRYPSIQLVAIDDFLSVRSWLVCSKKNEGKAIMAFPSRYASSEIGFFTTDASTREYIKTMERGILVNFAP